MVSLDPQTANPPLRTLSHMGFRIAVFFTTQHAFFMNMYVDIVSPSSRKTKNNQFKPSPTNQDSITNNQNKTFMYWGCIERKSSRRALDRFSTCSQARAEAVCVLYVFNGYNGNEQSAWYRSLLSTVCYPLVMPLLGVLSLSTLQSLLHACLSLLEVFNDNTTDRKAVCWQHQRGQPRGENCEQSNKARCLSPRYQWLNGHDQNEKNAYSAR